MDSAWPVITQPWHEGEQLLQQRTGMRERLAMAGPRVIRSYMPQQHQEFFAQLPFLLVGSVDAAGQPWASVLAAPPGFVRSPDPQQLVVQARPLAGDPLAQTLATGVPLGLLGIEPHTRRRNRLNGTVSAVGAQGFTVQVGQSFGNCPQYIQVREPVFSGGSAPVAATVSARLDAPARRIVEQADTFFIATAHPGAATAQAAAQGVDISHRGGRPGFVRMDSDATLTVPDYLGNHFFNTLGNLQINPLCGLLFIEFSSGTLLYLAARCQIVWEGPEVAAVEGAQRLLRLSVTQVRRLDAALPLRWA